MTTLSKSHKKAGGTFFLFLLFILAAGGVAIFFLFFEGNSPRLTISSPDQYLGKSGSITLRAEDDNSGLRTIRLKILQNDHEKMLFEESFPRSGYTGKIGIPAKEATVSFDSTAEGFSDGPAVITVEATDYSMRNFFRGNHTSISKEIIIDTTAPRISIIHSERYINPGGSGIVIYRLDEKGYKTGLQVNNHFNPGFLVGDGRDDTYISFFGLPYDTTGITQSEVIAVDQAGNSTVLPFSAIFKDTSFKHDRINVGNGFLEQKIPEFSRHYPEMKGSMIDQYLFTNNEVRKRNNQKISALCSNPHAERLWKGSFLRMAGSSRAGYADHRTYYHENKPIDKQVHLGIDIASTKNADVKAAEKGIVVYADYLGIYGNAVILDHGQGVFSLYSHLSQINVSKGETVEDSAVIGLTGTSGMAGGDHLHFSVLINGIFVTPKEWWDQHWINVTIEDPLTESRFK